LPAIRFIPSKKYELIQPFVANAINASLSWGQRQAAPLAGPD
jgi:hypothetical protein